MPEPTSADPREWTESELDAHLFRGDKSVGRMLGWSSYHVLRSRGSAAGFPDRVVWRDRILYVETKSVIGKATDEQRTVLTRLARAGGEVYLWRPTDLADIDAILGLHAMFVGAIDTNLPHLVRDFKAWAPGSIWLPDFGCRYDEKVPDREVCPWR